MGYLSILLEKLRDTLKGGKLAIFYGDPHHIDIDPDHVVAKFDATIGTAGWENADYFIVRPEDERGGSCLHHPYPSTIETIESHLTSLPSRHFSWSWDISRGVHLHRSPLCVALQVAVYLAPAYIAIFGADIPDEPEIAFAAGLLSSSPVAIKICSPQSKCQAFPHVHPHEVLR